MSFDSVEDQQAFAEKENFPYLLLSDPDRTAGAAYDAVRQEGDPGFEYGLPRRVSYLIGPDGVIVRSYDLTGHPDLTAHAAEVLADLQSLS